MFDWKKQLLQHLLRIPLSIQQNPVAEVSDRRNMSNDSIRREINCYWSKPRGQASIAA